ncbi:AEC family transporter [Zhongshania sp. BJYM1]|uniref:AEC family transporter n=1 Tax=Zhongshania aquatica TaxID=2965069 RepID=UPI0022B2D122|nr:AEC family transporter [Marortus sp. BJYM1]
MHAFLQSLSFSFSITGPIFAVLGLGVYLYRIGLINDNFVDVGSKLVFNVTLPALLFLSISQTHIADSANLELVAFGLIATLLAYLMLELLAALLVPKREDRGVVVQGGFRSNMGIIGLAYCVNAYGDAGLVAASLYLALVTILYNILAVITLNRSLNHRGGLSATFKGIVRNPLIISIVAALVVAGLELELPALLTHSGGYFSQMTLPLALLCTGASLDFRALRADLSSAMMSALCKLLFVPLLLVGAGIALGFRGLELGVLALMSSAPSAAASYIMVRAMGGNSALAANIIVLTTIGSLFTTSCLMMVLRSFALL